MRSERAFLLASILASTVLVQAQDTGQIGYIYCFSDNPQRFVPVFLEPCMKSRVGNFACGQKMEVVSQSGSALKVITSDGMTRFVNSSVVSQKAGELIPVKIEAGPTPDCKVAERDPTKNRPPRIVFQRNPDYPEHARRTREQSTVLLSLVVGADGRPHDIKVESSPGKDFSKNAVDAVQQWKFEPALKDGQPVEMPIHVDVTFRLISSP